jgi:hypothetical protein
MLFDKGGDIAGSVNAAAIHAYVIRAYIALTPVGHGWTGDQETVGCLLFA